MWTNRPYFTKSNLLSPFALRFSGFSYEDVMLGPVAEALGSALPASMPIYFSMQGEMGATVFRCVVSMEGQMADGSAMCA